MKNWSDMVANQGVLSVNFVSVDDNQNKFVLYLFIKIFSCLICASKHACPTTWDYLGCLKYTLQYGGSEHLLWAGR